MNKKGYTLIEVIVSIMILSIASITLAGAFGNVIHFMSNSNKVKNASNDMYAVIEGVDTKLKENVEVKKSVDIKYNIINNDKSISLQVDGTLNSYYVDNGSNINLSSIVIKEKNKFYETDEYKKLCNLVKQLISDIGNQKNQTCQPNVEGVIFCDRDGYDGTLFKSMTNDKSDFEFPKFPDELLPANLKGTSYNIYACFPWEIKVSEKQVNHGGILIYLRPQGRGEPSNTVQDPVKIICDYTTNAYNADGSDNKKDPYMWYYKKNESDSIYLRYFTDNKVLGQSDLSYNGDFLKYNSWESFRTSLTMKDSKWYKLDTDKSYDPENYNQKTDWIEQYWVPIN